MGMGRRSLGVAAATSLRFCKLLVDNPWAAPFYADELHELLLFDPKTDNLPSFVVHSRPQQTDTLHLTQITFLCYHEAPLQQVGSLCKCHIVNPSAEVLSV